MQVQSDSIIAREGQATGLGRVSSMGLGLSALVAAVTLLIDYPVATVALAIMAVGLFAAIWVRPTAWLIGIPLLIPTVDFGMAAGRLFITDFDFFLLVILAVLGLRGQAPLAPPGKAAAIWLLATMAAIGLVVGWQGATVGPVFDQYSQPINALRAAKPYLYLLAFAGVLGFQSKCMPQRFGQDLAVGILFGLLGCAMVALYEREVFTRLLEAGPMAAIRATLDFSGEYRISGMFSSMHTGGAAIDGYLALTVPFAFALCAGNAVDPRLRGLAALAFLAGAYAVMVTFSRGVQLAVIMACLLALLAIFRNPGRSVRPSALGFLIALTGFTLILSIARTYGGLVSQAALVAAPGLILAGYAVLSRLGLPLAVVWAGLVGLALLMIDAMGESSYRTPLSGLSLVVGGAAAIAMLFGLEWLCRQIWRGRLARWGVRDVLVISLLAGALSFGALGTQTLSRFQGLGDDGSSRVDHWQEALQAANTGLGALLFGNGAGSYTRLYHERFGATQNLAQYAFLDGRLRLGPGDYVVSQRLLEPQGQAVVLTLTASQLTGGKSRPLQLSICRRHILVHHRYNPTCQRERITLSPGAEPKERRLVFDQFENMRPLGLPLSLSIAAPFKQDVFDIVQVDVRDSTGRTLLANGDFRDGADHWVVISDFTHAQWHEDNNYIFAFVEYGLIGLSVILGVGIIALVRLWRDGGQSALSLAFAIGLVGLGAAGAVATVTNDPRIAFLFLLFLSQGLAPVHRRASP